MNLKALVSILLIAAPAVADSDYTHPGPYAQAAGMKLISAFVFPEKKSDASPVGAGFMASVGYRFSPWYAVQVDYLWGEMTDSVKNTEPGLLEGSTSLETETWSIMASGKLYPLASTGSRFQPYGMIGMGVLQVDAAREDLICMPACTPSDTPDTINGDFIGFAMKYGGGADIHLTNQIYGFLDYAFYHSIQNAIKPFDFHAIGGGVGFRW